MKKHIYSLVAFAAVCGMLFTGCKKDPIDREGGITLNATLERVGGPDSKMYIGNNDIPHFFASGETVNVNGAECSIVGSGTGDDARYSIPGVAPQTDGKYYAVYPASIVVAPEEATRDNTYSETTDGAVQCNIHFPHVQNYVEEEGKQKLDLPVGAVITDNSRVLRFYNLCSLVEVTYNPQGQTVKLTSIEVTAINKGLWGDGVATLSDTSSKLAFTYNGRNSRVVLDIPNKTFSTSTTFYVIVPPYDGNTEFSVKLRFDDGHSSVTKTKASVNLPRNSIVALTSNDTPEEDTEISGYFSISSSCKVVFSRGNLQHRGDPWVVTDGTRGTTPTWFFADNQYDFYGTNNLASQTSYTESEVLSQTVDLFCMSCRGNGVSSSFVAHGSNAQVIPEPSYGLRAPDALIDNNYSSYLDAWTVDFADWGELQISGDAPKTWFTLNSTEWNYLLNQRVGENGRNLRANVQITGVQNHPAGNTTTIKGFMLFPDDWTDDDIPSGITNFSYGSVNSISYDDWRRFEAAGAVFLPAAGWRNPDVSRMGNIWIVIEHTYNDGYYWTSSYDAVGESSYMYYQFNANNYLFGVSTNESQWHFGQSVRLVKPAPGYTYEDANRSTWGPVSTK